MCYYNGVKVTSEEKFRLKALAKYVRNYDFLDNPLYIGPNYPHAPMMRKLAGQEDFELVLKEWGFLPPYIQTEERIAQFREDYITLNAKVENLFYNDDGKESLYSDAAINRRCLIPSTGFFEYRHIHQRGKKGQVLKSTVAYPYHIKLKDLEIFYLAGIWNPNAIRGDNWSIVTTEANLLMSQIHNKKKRMPTILTEDLAWRWMFGDLSRAQIQEAGSFQFDSLKMDYYTVGKDFQRSSDPLRPVFYAELPELGDDVMGTGMPELF